MGWRTLCGLCAAAAWWSLAVATASGGDGGTLTVGTETLCEFKGWGVFPAAYDRRLPTYSDGSPAHGDAGWLPEVGSEPGAVHEAVGGLGFDIARVGLSPLTGRRDGTLDPDRMQDLTDHLAILRRVGIRRYVLTQWSPPPHMKTPDRVRYGRFEGRKQALDPAFADGEGYDLADYLADVCAVLARTESGAPMAVSIQNEPDVDQTYDSCVYTETPEQRAVYRAVVKQLRNRLDARGLGEIRILATEHSGSGGVATLLGEPSGRGFAELGRDPALAEAVGGFAFHQYYTSDRVGTLRAAMAAYEGRDRWMTEVCDDATPLRPEERSHSGDEELDVALDMTRRMAADFTDFRVNYWFWWRAWHSTGGKGYPAQDLVYNDGEGRATVMKLGQALRLLWTTVEPGWRVQATAVEGVDLRTDNEAIINGFEPNGNMMSRGVDVVAFEQPSEKRSCVLIVNATGEARALAGVRGLRGESARIHRLTAQGLREEADAVPIAAGSSGPLAIPPHSLTLLISGGR